MSDAFRDELSALLPRLRRFALGLTADADKADDLVQAGCERALAKQDQYQPGTRLDSWMYRIMQNLWIDQMRAKKEDVPAEAEEIEAVPDRDFNRSIEAQLSLRQVLAAMQQLPPQMRAVLTLVCVEDQSYKEAAETLGVPIGTVMSRLARARIELHRVLSGGNSGPSERDDHAPLH